MAETPARRRLAAATHVLPLRVYWEDTDALGIVYYANYLKFIERARSDMLRAAGIDQAALWREQGIAFAVRSCAIEFRRPARLADELEVHSRLVSLRGASVLAEQSVVRPEGEGGVRVLAEARLRLACIGPQGRPRRLPLAVVRALATLSPSLSPSFVNPPSEDSKHGD